MKSYHVSLGAGISGITCATHDDPVPGRGEVVVRVRAASLNARDLSILRGVYPLPVKPEVVPLADGSGEVVAIGAGVTRAKVGDRVACAVFPAWIAGRFGWEYSAQTGGSLDGMLTELALVSEETVVHIPEHLSFVEAATFPCAGVTAWNALTGGVRRPLAGDTVLTLGSGGVSLFALQFAKAFGMRVIATTSNAENAQRLMTMGADDVIDYIATPDWGRRVRELTAGRGVDRVVEVGGAGTLARSLQSLAADGEIAMVGWLANQVTTISVQDIASTVATLRRIAVGSRTQFEEMNRAVAAHALKPVVDRIFPFDDAVAAFRDYEDDKHFGKVVIAID